MRARTYRGNLPLTETSWKLVAQRDARADAQFLYGVRTMNVVCRPSCPSRRPNRVNVELFDGLAAAQEAGYRACKRCRPDVPRAPLRLQATVTDCALGVALLARNARGLCALLLGDDAHILLQHLAKRFPRAGIVVDPAALAVEAARLHAFLAAPAAGFDTELDLAGTDFQLAVWTALLAVPSGSTATYAEIARRIGRPHAVRAVGTACAANPVALAVPCHRVVRSDGSDHRYAWGAARKRALLALEAAA